LESTAVLFSSGLDSAVLAAAEAQRRKVHPVYVSAGLAWESEELAAVDRLLASPVYRDLAPIVRLSFTVEDLYPPTHWALRGTPPGFDTADEEVYLFKAVAKSNPADERLIAMGQVRDLTPLHDSDGRLVALPSVEDAITAGLDAIRNVQAQRPQNKRFDTNRIMMYVWPSTELAPEELNALVQRLLPTSVGTGLEEVQFIARQRNSSGGLTDVAVRITLDPGNGAQVFIEEPSTEPGS